MINFQLIGALKFQTLVIKMTGKLLIHVKTLLVWQKEIKVTHLKLVCNSHEMKIIVTLDLDQQVKHQVKIVTILLFHHLNSLEL